MHMAEGFVKRTTIMLPDDLKAKASRLARRAGLSLGEIIRTSLAARIANKAYQPGEDSLFSDRAVFGGKAPRDAAQNHDDYLYGRK
jgi:hypothetical protein